MLSRSKMKWVLSAILISTFFAIGYTGISIADEKITPYLESFQEAKEGISLLETIKTGGVVMGVLALLSVVATTSIIYNFTSLKANHLVPEDFGDQIINDLEAGRLEAVRSSCQREKNIIAKVVSSGLAKKSRGIIHIREAMENCAHKEINKLWQNISYLADIASVAPLIGLLGTVLGMIQAFNVIAFQSAVVKPMLLAGGISKAMITTAGGLIVAIPAMLFHSYFKGKLLEISDNIETYTTDIIRLIEKV